MHQLKNAAIGLVDVKRGFSARVGFFRWVIGAVLALGAAGAVWAQDSGSGDEGSLPNLDNLSLTIDKEYTYNGGPQCPANGDIKRAYTGDPDDEILINSIVCINNTNVGTATAIVNVSVGIGDKIETVEEKDGDLIHTLITITPGNMVRGEKSIPFSIVKKDFAKSDITTMIPAAGHEYNGKPLGIEPISIKGSGYGEITRLYGADTTTPVNAGKYEITVKITGGNNYNAGEAILGQYVITKKALTGTVSDINDDNAVRSRYTDDEDIGKGIDVSRITVLDPLWKGDIVAEYAEGESAEFSETAPTEEGKYKVRLKLVNDANFEDVTIALGNTYYTITVRPDDPPTPITLASVTVTGDRKTKIYDGTTAFDGDNITAVTFTGVADGDTLVKGEDYTIVAAYDTKDVGASKTVKVRVNLQKGDIGKKYIFAGDKDTASYSVTGCAITAKPIAINADSSVIAAKVYDGTLTATIDTVMFFGLAAGDTLAKTSGYTITEAKYDSAGAGIRTVTAKIALVPSGAVSKNYTLSAEESNFSKTGVPITRKVITIDSFTVKPQVYNGTTKVDSSSVKVVFKGMLAGYTLVYGTDFTVNANYDSAGVGTNRKVTAKVTMLGTSNYAVTSVDTFTVANAVITKAKPKAEDFDILWPNDKIANGTEQNFDLSNLSNYVKVKAGIVGMGNIINIKYKNEKGAMVDPKDAGEYIVYAKIVEGANYFSADTLNLGIYPIHGEDEESIDGAKVTVSGTYVYNGGKGIEPAAEAIVVKVGDKTLVNGTDYRIFKIDNNKDAGDSAVVTVSGKIPNYFGTVLGYFKIEKKTPTVDDLTFTIPTNHVYVKDQPRGIGEVKVAGDGYGEVKVLYDGSEELPVAAKTYAVSVIVMGGSNYKLGTVALGNYRIFADSASISVKSVAREIPSGNVETTVVVAPVALITGEFTAGPNPVGASAGTVKLFRAGKRVNDGVLAIFDATGKFVGKVRINDKITGATGKREIGSWDLKDAKGKQVAAGTYLIKGKVKTADGKSEKVSLLLGVSGN